LAGRRVGRYGDPAVANHPQGGCLSPTTTTSPISIRHPRNPLPCCISGGKRRLRHRATAGARPRLQPPAAPHFATRAVTTREAWRGWREGPAQSKLLRANVRAGGLLAWRSVARRGQISHSQVRAARRQHLGMHGGGGGGCRPRHAARTTKRPTWGCCPRPEAHKPRNQPLTRTTNSGSILDLNLT
jgi:hypothetical protein